jgi:neutral ceramidase
MVEKRRALLPLEALRNRSPETFMVNSEADAMMTYFDDRVKELGGEWAPTDDKSCVKEQKEREQDGGWDMNGCPRLRAVDRVMTIVDVADSAGPIAKLVFGAVHPTVAPPETPLFSSDFVGLAMRQLELKPSAGRLVAAFFNGAEGDISARRIERDVRDVWRHASLMRIAIEGAKEPVSIDLSAGIESRMHFAFAGEVLSVAGEPDFRLASKPKAGAALLGGGEGDRTPLYQLGWKERVTDRRANADQGAKLNALKPLLLPLLDKTWLLATSSSFPRVLPLGYAHMGALNIVSTPTEMSTATGYNIRKMLGFDTILIGLANEYASYTATADEYAVQDYMGASTLWGPQESNFFVRALSMLQHNQAFESDGEPKDRPGFGSSKLKPFDVGARRQAVDEDLDLILRDKYRTPVRDLPFITWEDQESDDDTYDEAANTCVAIEEESGTLVEDDSAGRLIILLREKPKDAVRRWTAIWLAPLEDTLSASKVVFTIKTASGTCYKSNSFTAFDKGDRGPLVTVQCPARSQICRQ